MTVGIERPLEAVRNIPAPLIPDARDGFRSHATSCTRTADEKQLGVFGGARRIEHLRQPLRKARIYLAVRRGLPLHRQDALADLLEVGKPDEGPLGTRAHVDQNRAGILLKAR